MAETARPNPDALLSAIERDEETRKRGKLKIFFGACAGVGKTFAMLEAAQAKKRQGVDVAVGVVETHRRKETEALTAGLEILPRKSIEYKGVTLQEFDLDAALARRPALILIDELAHTNAPGSRHLKRWQDIDELLEAGIDVYSTLNTQHLESLNDTVAKITNVVVRETVPDAVFDRADDVELVDLPVGELLQRMKDGKVYLSEQAGRAMENFFQEGNLFALREIALRKTAQRVDFQMRQYRERHAVKGIWQASERLLVCVGPSPFSTRLIRRTKQISDDLKAPWMAVYVETPQTRHIPEAERLAVESQLRFAESLGAETVVLQGLDPADEILKFAREKNVTRIVVGKPARPRWKDFVFGSLVDRILRGSGDIEVYSVSGDARTESGKKRFGGLETPKTRWHRYVVPLAVIALWTVFVQQFFLGMERVNLAMVYLLMNVVIALRFGQGPSLAATLLSVAAFDFFFVPPYFTFAVSDARFVVTFAVMFVVTFLVARLTIQLRRSAEGASARERFTADLYSFSREMSAGRDPHEIAQAVATHLSRVLRADVVILLGSDAELMFLEATSGPDWRFSDTDRAVAQWVFKNAKAAGHGTQTLPSAQGVFLPLNASRGVVGVLGLRPAEGTSVFGSRGQHFTESVMGQAALAIERSMLAEEAQTAEVEAKKEGLISALLSSVSHDLRTPLTSIAGAASTLLSSESKLSAENERKLLETINEESNRLNRLVGSILQITKIESGKIGARKEPHSLEEIVGSALNRMDKLLEGRPVHTAIPENLPLVPMDAVLIEQVLVNFIENALRYTPPGSPIDVTASAGPECVTVTVGDRGPGVPRGDQKRVFEKFFRGGRRDVWGSGLGLAICEGIVSAHEGKIGVKDREGGGSEFFFSLPLS